VGKHKIVIVGGGYGGAKAALELSDDHRFDITVISDRPDFSEHGSLYKVATGHARRLASIPLSEIFAAKNLHLLQATVTSLDRKARTITTADGQKLPYDALILGMGMRTNYFHIEGLDQYSYGIKSIEDAEEFKRHLHRQLSEDKHPDLNYVVIGGGPTGIELSGALPSYIRRVAERHGMPSPKAHVDLIEAAPRLVPRMPKSMSRRITRHLRSLGVKIYLKTTVQAQTADALMANNKPIRSHTVVWTAGVTNHPFFTENGFQLAHNGKVRVDQFLQAEPGIYAIGDNADTAYTGMAQTAINDAKYVAQNLIRLADDQAPVPYIPKQPIYVFPAGPYWAAVLWGPIKIYGLLGWLLRTAADWIAYHDYQPWQLATKRWLAESVEEESCHLCNGTRPPSSGYVDKSPWQ
jgi:NADH:ubiquinone reductase (H+-translocating)